MSDSHALALVNKYQSRGVVPDTNLLLVYLIGLHDPDLIARFKRTQAFRAEDFELLYLVLSRFRCIATTPSVLTEVNSLCNQLPEQIKRSFLATFKNQIAVFHEQYNTSKDICQHSHFQRTGLTDSAIMVIAKNNFLVLTDDFRLAGYLEELGIDYINFNHIRLLEP